MVGGTGHARFRRGLVVAQVVPLGAAAGRARCSSRAACTTCERSTPAFQTEHLLGFSINPALSGYSRERTVHLFERIQEELGRIPGVESAAASVIALMSDDNWSATVRVEGYQA